jgi:hypothetical protein
MLVSTYAPVVLAIVKSSVFVLLAQVLVSLAVPIAVRFVVICAVMYLDFNKVRQDKFERASGFLFLVGMSMYLQQEDPVACPSIFEITSQLVDVAWAVLSSTWIVVSCLGMKAHVPFHGVVCMASVFACMHILGSCAVFPFVEFVIRINLYLLMCSIMFFGKRWIPNLERNGYARSISFVCSHMLVASVYIILPSFFICFCAFFTLAYKSRSQEFAPDVRLESCDPKPPTRYEAPLPTSEQADHEEQNRLSKQLRAALAQTEGASR